MSTETQAPRITVASAGRHVGETVEIAGWLYNLRRSGKICFPQVRDGSGIIQCVAVKSALPEPLFEALKDLTQESSLVIRGKVRAEARAQGGYELDVEDATIVQRVPESDPYPITPKDHGIDFLMDHRHLWIRSRRQNAALLVRHEVIKGIRDYFDSHGFVLVDAPVFTPCGLRRHIDIVRSGLLRRREGLPDAIRAALRRSYSSGVRQNLLLRSRVSCGEIEDAASSD